MQRHVMIPGAQKNYSHKEQAGERVLSGVRSVREGCKGRGTSRAALNVWSQGLVDSAGDSFVAFLQTPDATGGPSLVDR